MCRYEIVSFLVNPDRDSPYCVVPQNLVRPFLQGNGGEATRTGEVVGGTG